MKKVKNQNKRNAEKSTENKRKVRRTFYNLEFTSLVTFSTEYLMNTYFSVMR